MRSLRMSTVLGYFILVVTDVHMYLAVGCYILFFGLLFGIRLILERCSALFFIPRILIFLGVILSGISCIVEGRSDFMTLTGASLVILGTSFIGDDRVTGVVSTIDGPLYFCKLVYCLPIGVNKRKCDDILGS